MTLSHVREIGYTAATVAWYVVLVAWAGVALYGAALVLAAIRK